MPSVSIFNESGVKVKLSVPRSLASEVNEPDADRTLPALRGLAKMSHCHPIIAIDGREQAPLVFTRFQTVRSTLYSGDYSICGLETVFSIEKKSLDDLVCCSMAANRERFQRELHRLRGYQFKRLLVIGSREDIAAGRYHSKINPKSVLATLGAFEVRYSIPVVFAATAQEAADLIERWVWWYSREVIKATNSLLRGCLQQSNRSTLSYMISTR